MTLIVFNLEALLVRLRRFGDSGWTQGNPEADAVVPVRRVVPEPERRPTKRGLVVPTAATEHAVRAHPWSNGIAIWAEWSRQSARWAVIMINGGGFEGVVSIAIFSFRLTATAMLPWEAIAVGVACG